MRNVGLVLRAHVLGKREVDEDFSFFAALILLSSWAAFEAYVDDACKAMLQIDPTLVAQGHLARVRLSPAEQQLDQSAQFDAYLRRGSFLGQKTTFVEKIEWQLELVGLNGPVPPDLADNVNASKLVRNVWAHKAGKAVQYFVDNCPGKSLSVGNTVTVSKATLGSDLVGLVTLALIIINRFRVANGMPPLEPFAGSAEAPNPFKPAVDLLFPNSVIWSVLGTV